MKASLLNFVGHVIMQGVEVQRRNIDVLSMLEKIEEAKFTNYE